MISNNNDVQTAMQVNLLQAIHELTHYFIHSLDGGNNLREMSETNKHSAAVSTENDQINDTS